MNSKFYKHCSVPLCPSTTIKTPNKLFISVPRTENMRKKWLQLARKDPSVVSVQSKMHFCEDHFDLPRDMENYTEFRLMGSVSRVRMRPGVLPMKFGCQLDRKRGSGYVKIRPLILKKQRVEQAKQLEQAYTNQCIPLIDVEPNLNLDTPEQVVCEPQIGNMSIQDLEPVSQSSTGKASNSSKLFKQLEQQTMNLLNTSENIDDTLITDSLNNCFTRVHDAIKQSKTILNENKQHQNEFDVFCESLAIQLKKMPLDRALICQQKLQQVMTEERLFQITNCDSSMSSESSLPLEILNFRQFSTISTPNHTMDLQGSKYTTVKDECTENNEYELDAR